MGRPAFQITEEVCQKAEEYASHGLTKKQTAHNLGISYDTLNVKAKEYPKFSKALKRGRAKGIGNMVNALYQAGIEGNTTAMIFFLKNMDKENWKDDRHLNVTKTTVKYTAVDRSRERLDELLGSRPSGDAEDHISH